jgi:hypothetical protein
LPSGGKIIDTPGLREFALMDIEKNEKYGCPTNGKNIGAERILSGDKAAIKAAQKAKKFKS